MLRTTHFRRRRFEYLLFLLFPAKMRAPRAARRGRRGGTCGGVAREENIKKPPPSENETSEGGDSKSIKYQLLLILYLILGSSSYQCLIINTLAVIEFHMIISSLTDNFANIACCAGY